MPRVLSVYGDVHVGARDLAVLVVQMHGVHVLVAAAGDYPAVHHSADALALDLVRIVHAGLVHVLAVLLRQRAGYRVVGEALRESCVLKKLRLAERFLPLRVHRYDLEDAPCQGAGLVESHSIGLGQRLQIVAALDEYALGRRPSNASEKAQRY